MVRVAIVDDEPEGRAALRTMLQSCAGVDIVAECRDGIEAVEVLQWTDVDLLFLDVQMPGLDGFGVIHALGPGRTPTTVFVTAYDSYALKAFEVEALDYVLKPFDQSRFAAAFERARRRIDERRSADWAQQLRAATPASAAPPPRAQARLPVPVGDRIVFVSFDDIDCIQAADQYVTVCVGMREYLLRDSLERIGARLPADRFARIHRSHLVNGAKVVEVRRLEKGDAEVTLAGGRRLRMSRRFRRGLRGRFGWAN